MGSAFALPSVDFLSGAATGDTTLERQTMSLKGDSCTLIQTLLSASGTGSAQQVGDHQEVLFVISGSGSIICGTDERPLTPLCGVSLPPRCEFRVTARTPSLELMRVQIIPHDETAAAHSPFRVRSFEEAASGEATGGRDFQVLLDRSSGFDIGTLFLGNVPPGPAAPVHYHLYDEVICILEGTAVVHIHGEDIIVERGCCYRLPARILHQVDNTGSGRLREIGFFVPEGTPAGAYLPDGQAAFDGIADDPEGPRATWTVPQSDA